MFEILINWFDMHYVKDPFQNFNKLLLRTFQYLVAHTFLHILCIVSWLNASKVIKMKFSN